MTKTASQEEKGAYKTGTPSALFFSMGVDMTWRLALSVLVPIIGGAELDNHFNTAPIFLIVGFILAIALTIVTIRRTLELTKKVTFITDKKRKEADD